MCDGGKGPDGTEAEEQTAGREAGKTGASERGRSRREVGATLGRPAFRGSCVCLDVDGDVAMVGVDLPGSLSLMWVPALNELSEAIDEVEDAVRPKVVVFGPRRGITPGQRGGEQDESMITGRDRDEATAYSLVGQSVTMRMERCIPPSIMVCRGEMFGGILELALACDLRVASEEAVFSLPHVEGGLIPGWGGTQRLARMIGPTRAREMILTGKSVTAHDAESIGLVNQVVPIGGLEDAVGRLAKELASRDRAALMAAKKAINGFLDEPLVRGLDLETRQWSGLFWPGG